MVWGNISWKGVGRIVRVDERLNADGYIALLEENLLPSVEEMGLGSRWIFQQDGAPCHTAKKTMDWFKANDVTLMEWPPQSPDLNPIGKQDISLLSLSNTKSIFHFRTCMGLPEGKSACPQPEEQRRALGMGQV